MAHDPCLFLGKGLLVIMYVDEILIYGKSQSDVDALVKSLQDAKIAIHAEGTADRLETTQSFLNLV